MFESKGIKRTLSIILFIVAQAAQFIPPVAPYVPLLNEVAAILGVAGIAHASISAKKKAEK